MVPDTPKCITHLERGWTEELGSNRAWEKGTSENEVQETWSIHTDFTGTGVGEPSERRSVVNPGTSFY